MIQLSTIPRTNVLIVSINNLGVIALHLYLVKHSTFRCLLLRSLQLCEIGCFERLYAVVAHWDHSVDAVRMERAPLFLQSDHRVLVLLKTHIAQGS